MPPSKRKDANKANVEKTRHVKAARAARAAQAARAEPEESVRRSRSLLVLPSHTLAPRVQIDEDELARFQGCGLSELKLGPRDEGPARSPSGRPRAAPKRMLS